MWLIHKTAWYSKQAVFQIRDCWSEKIIEQKSLRGFNEAWLVRRLEPLSRRVDFYVVKGIPRKSTSFSSDYGQCAFRRLTGIEELHRINLFAF